MRGISPVVFGAALLLATAAGLSTADEPKQWWWGTGGTPADIGREVLWLDNPDFGGNASSSEVIGAFDLWTEVATDFLFETDATIRKVTWWGWYWNGFEEPTGSGFNLRFYHHGTGCLPEDAPFVEYLLPGNDCCETLANGGDQFSQFVYEYCLDVQLAPGHYWFSAQMADHAFPPQWGRLTADRVQVCDSGFRCPFFGWLDWVPIGSTGILYPFDFGQMFEDVCAPTAVETASWGTVKGLYR